MIERLPGEMSSTLRLLLYEGLTKEEAAKQMARLKELAKLPGLGLSQGVEASIALQVRLQNAIKDTGTRVALTENIIRQFSNAIALTGGGPAEFQKSNYSTSSDGFGG